MTDSAAADRVEIEELHRTYADVITTGDLARLDAVYTADATWVHPSIGEVRGLERIRAQLADELDRLQSIVMVSHGGPVTLHGDRANARCYLSEWVFEPDAAPQHLVGVYEDELVRGSGGWRYRRRRYVSMLRTELP